ncbi:MAG TPA: cytochrome c biogenesis protein ResB [Actinomycetes bacterium]|nr:cytochrome c biogenesis protein ResB [Actinomycetes bacterium]
MSADPTPTGAPAAAGLSTAPVPTPDRPGALRPREFARWIWRQLTSMRTALVLLFLLAVAAVPGSLVPQESVSPIRVVDFKRDHPTLGPIYERLGMFDVYTSPWFAAIYLLLIVSLVGCILPRSRAHLRALRATPPATPRNLARLAAYRTWGTDATPEAVLERSRAVLRKRRFRVAPGDGSVAAEAGYLRETGNLVFHIALLLMLAAVALGSLFGWKGTVLVPEGSSFANTVSEFDSFTKGALVDERAMVPFTLALDKLDVRYQQTGQQAGAPRGFTADVTFRPDPAMPAQRSRIQVNSPLVVDGTKVFLMGNGYAPRFTVRDAAGTVVFAGAVPFLPQESTTFTSTGVIKVPDIKPEQLGFSALFLPTAKVDPELGPVSVFPDALNPEVFLGAYKGDLGIDAGLPKSVYRLDTDDMTLVANGRLLPGQTLTLPDGLGSITYDGWTRWANFQVADDPGRFPALVAALAAIGGLMLSLFIRRRRVWVRAVAGPGGRTVVEVAGLARSESTALEDEIASLTDELGGPGESRPDPSTNSTGKE